VSYVKEEEQAGGFSEADAPDRREETDWPSIKPDLAGDAESAHEQDPDDPGQPPRSD
jgi:hypothetical protein